MLCLNQFFSVGVKGLEGFAEESGNEKLKRKKWLNMSRSERGKKKGKQKKRRLTGKQNPERGNSFNDLHVEKAGNESGGS